MIEKLEPIEVGRADDLTRQKFGHLQVLYRVSNKNGRTIWQCQCDCGNYFTTGAKELKSGRSKSCGCSTNENHIKDYTGQTFNKLTVLGMADHRASDNTILWTCQCACGRIIDVRAGNLKRQKSCGKCFSGRDLTNQKFGKLTALKYDHTSTSKKSIWLCKCDCGAYNLVSSNDLVSGKTQSCGCVKSRGEEKIAEILNKNNLPFIKQKSFNDCRFPDSDYKAQFDFFVNDTYIIEYDGIQHFEALGGWSSKSNVLATQNHDNFKTQWCLDNHIPIIRIPYTHLDQLSLQDLILETSTFVVDEGPTAWEKGK